MKTIPIDGEDVGIDTLSDETLIFQFRCAEASIVSSALGEINRWDELGAKRSAEAKLRSLQDEVRRRKLVIE